MRSANHSAGALRLRCVQRTLSAPEYFYPTGMKHLFLQWAEWETWQPLHLINCALPSAQNGLADYLGGLEDAIETAKRLAKMPLGKVGENGPAHSAI